MEVYMSQTCFQVYGTKRKTTFSEEEEPQNQFCSVAKRACVSPFEMVSMEDECPPDTAHPAITQQPPAHPPPDLTVHPPIQPALHGKHHHHGNHHQERHHRGPNNWSSWRKTGQAVDWKAAVCPQPVEERIGDTRSGNEGCRASACGGGDGENIGLPLGCANGAQSNPRVEIDGRGDGDWQSPENLRRQLEKQVHTPDLEHTRHETLRARVQKLKTQLQFINSMELESNDYWALPQENRLRMEDDLEQARIAMETDYVPDPVQYHCIDRPVPMAGPSYTTQGVI